MTTTVPVSIASEQNHGGLTSDEAQHRLKEPGPNSGERAACWPCATAGARRAKASGSFFNRRTG
jgi:hypothetical protein